MRKIGWRSASVPLPAAGVVALGPCAQRLARRLLAEPGLLAGLRGAAGPDVLVLLGDSERLPWVDGVTYVGRHASEARVLWPTSLEPDAPPQLVERALLARHGHVAPPLVWLPTTGVVLSVANADAMDPTRLNAWGGGADAASA